MVAAGIKDPRVLKELSRRFRAAKPLRLVEKGGRVTVRGADDFERRQEYLLRLLDHYWFVISSRMRRPRRLRARRSRS
jgi:hypothetical protein